MALVRRGPAGKLVVISDSAAGPPGAAPAPCTILEAISSTGSPASPPASEAREKTRRPTMKMRRRPTMSAPRPPRISSPLNAMAYPVTTHCTTELATPKSRSIDGSAIFTMVKSSTIINDATRINASRRLARAVSWGISRSLWVGMAGESGTDARSAGMAPIRTEADGVRKPASSNSDDHRAHARAQCSARHTPRPRRTPPIGRELRTRHILLPTGVDDRPAREASHREIRLSGGNHEPDREPDQAVHRAPVAVVELKVRWPAAECHGWRAARGKPGAGLP